MPHRDIAMPAAASPAKPTSAVLARSPSVNAGRSIARAILLAATVTCVFSATVAAQGRQARALPSQDRAAPSLLPVEADLTLAMAEQRWAAMVKSNGPQGLSTGSDTALLGAMARGMACGDIVGVQPMGIALTRENPKHLHGARVFARCGGEAYAFVTVTTAVLRQGVTAYTMDVGFKGTVAGLPARTSYFKSARGNEKTALILRAGPHTYSIEYYAPGTAGKLAMDSQPALEAAALVVQSRAAAPATSSAAPPAL